MTDGGTLFLLDDPARGAERCHGALRLAGPPLERAPGAVAATAAACHEDPGPPVASGQGHPSRSRPLSAVPAAPAQSIEVELIAVLVAVAEDEPRVLTIRDGALLPSGPFETGHRSLQAGLRAWVERQTGHPLGYVEQLYTFADRDRSAEDAARRFVSISYLALTRQAARAAGQHDASWRSWYRYFPWEDWRDGPPPMVAKAIAPALRTWAAAASEPALRRERQRRARIAFALGGLPWNEELVLQRYELLFEAGLVPEAIRRRGGDGAEALPGAPMLHDHRRILATAIARLRAKIKYRPVVFELMPESFTLLQLQRTVEALAGLRLHKQNFRRLIEQQALVEETGEVATETGGRPAKLFRFRPQVLHERAAAGTKLPLARGV
ncbi:hypothetical protein GCM10010964_42600 [Caldovatus sediminis]|uniref:NrtR DNA-binding winged helix domain-containing protein n=1 Tax=Caldovatus sediminis TaxID=2041189 RepID=A0A8J2ZF68_9PROT|nr:hypothetical protein GCM10010964_42600 [Caldovatus sediminis]